MPSASHRFIRPAAASGLVPASGQPPITLPSTGQASFCAVGASVDVEFGQALMNTGAWIDLGEVGPTWARPSCRRDEAGRKFIDSTLGVLIVWDGDTWRGLNGASV